jgi:formyltetrahydrofolate deformylase
MDDQQKTWVLLFQCPDQRGIVAKISDFIFQLDGNIITADQYATARQGGTFFIRIEFVISRDRWNKQSLSQAFLPVIRHFGAHWSLFDKEDPLRMGIFVSQPDHCLFELLYLWKSGELKVRIPFVVSNCEAHRELVSQFGIPFHFVPATRQERKEQELLAIAGEASDFLVLARYMLTLSGDFLARYGKDIINIHHSFLPSFKGARPYQQAYDNGVKVIGATAHFVVEHLDEGPIISQEVVRVTHRDDVESLKRKGKNLEKLALSHALLQYIDYRIIRYQNKTIVFEDK